MYLYEAVLFALRAAVLDAAGGSFLLSVGNHLLLTYLPLYSFAQVFVQIVVGGLVVLEYWRLSEPRRWARVQRRY